MNKVEYKRYLQSSHWQKVRSRRLAVANQRCEFRPEIEGWYNPKHGPALGERCAATDNLEVHHLHYKSVGAENHSDLEVLCRFHHLVREAVGDLYCSECGDGPMSYDEGDIINQVEQAIAQAGGINSVDLEDIRAECSWVISCSYCSR